LQSAGIPLSIWRIHRRIGMSGGLFANALLREMGQRISPTSSPVQSWPGVKQTCQAGSWARAAVEVDRGTAAMAAAAILERMRMISPKKIRWAARR
jgi:hypothetical protein